MTDERKLNDAKQVYQTLCKALDSREWTYQREDEELTVRFGIRGDDEPMYFVIEVDANRQLIRLASPFPFKMSEANRVAGALITTIASSKLANGCFDYQASTGSIAFRMTSFFHECSVGQEHFLYLVDVACHTVDQFNDRFLAVDRGEMGITDFIREYA